MPKFIITWNIGYGDSAQTVDVPNQEAAEKAAYEAAREEFENNASYGAEPYTAELAEELGIE